VTGTQLPFNRPIPNSKPQSKGPSGLGTLVEAEKLLQIAILLPSAAIIGWLLGAWADGLLHQSWIGIVGMIFGGIAGLVYVIRLVTSKSNNSNAQRGSQNGKGSSDITP